MCPETITLEAAPIETPAAPEVPAAAPAPEAPAAAPVVPEAPAASALDNLRKAAKEVGKAPKTEKPEGKEEPPMAAAPKADPAVVVPAKYTPNMKLKIMDKDFEIDKFLESVIVDADTEKKIRDLYTKAIGLDFAKPKHEETKQQLEGLNQGIDALQQMLSPEADEAAFQQFVDFWKIPKEKLYKLVASQLRYEELPADEKARIDRDRQQADLFRQTKDQNTQLLEQHQQTLVTTRARDLDTAISRPDIAEVAKEYDTRKGVPGSFRTAVIHRGRVAAVVNQKDISVDEAVREVMSDLGYVETDQPEQARPLAAVSPVTQTKLPTLPNLGAGGAAPVTKAVKSLADLRELSKKARNA